jgi:DNA-binding FrmR family transcriptional regulator
VIKTLIAQGRPQEQIVRQIHDAHGAPTQLAEDPVAIAERDLGPRHAAARLGRTRGRVESIREALEGDLADLEGVILHSLKQVSSVRAPHEGSLGIGEHLASSCVEGGRQEDLAGVRERAYARSEVDREALHEQGLALLGPLLVNLT